ncbi:MAG: hypothetical protein ABIR11_04165 [Candidatus Limnocylindrales bacterium]
MRGAARERTHHASASWFLRGRYERWLARGMNPLQWVEYAVSSTVMIVAIAYVSFTTDFPALVAIAGTNVAMNLFGWSMESANAGREKVDWKHYIFGSFNTVAITVVLQYEKVWRWADYLYGEKTYMVLSLVAKSLLAGRSGPERSARRADRGCVRPPARPGVSSGPRWGGARLASAPT